MVEPAAASSQRSFEHVPALSRCQATSDVSDEEFATMMIQTALADADDGGLSVEVQIEVLDQVVQAMRDALT